MTVHAPSCSARPYAHSDGFIGIANLPFETMRYNLASEMSKILGSRKFDQQFSWSRVTLAAIVSPLLVKNSTTGLV